MSRFELCLRPMQCLRRLGAELRVFQESHKQYQYMYEHGRVSCSCCTALLRLDHFPRLLVSHEPTIKHLCYLLRQFLDMFAVVADK